jgi:outer membrane immunogenic protein
MTRFKLFPLLAAAVAFSATAQGADLGRPIGSYKDDAPIYGPSWTGFYLGVHGGYATGDWTGDLTFDGKADSLFARDRKIDADGWFGGGQIGYNRQIGAIVIGGEADISGGGIEGKSRFVSGAPLAGVFAKDIDSKLDYFGTVRARIGYSMGRFLPYVTGGLAWGHTESDLTVTNVPFVNLFGGPSGKGSVEEDHVGWTIGGGVEWAVSQAWSVKAEYLYVDLGSADYRFTGTVAPAAGGGVFNTDGFRSDLTFNTFKVGLNYRVGNDYAPLK